MIQTQDTVQARGCHSAGDVLDLTLLLRLGCLSGDSVGREVAINIVPASPIGLTLVLRLARYWTTRLTVRKRWISRRSIVPIYISPIPKAVRCRRAEEQ